MKEFMRRHRMAWIWISGFWAGVFLGALAACPAKHVSLPSSAAFAALFYWLGARR